MSASPLRRSGVNPVLRPKRPKVERDNATYGEMFPRLLRAYVRRIGDGDGDLAALAELAALRDELEAHLVDAVAVLRHSTRPASWTEIGMALGTTPQAAQQRYGKVGGARRPGGQPAHLRTWDKTR
jgi:hypothetical protein